MDSMETSGPLIGKPGDVGVREQGRRIGRAAGEPRPILRKASSR